MLAKGRRATQWLGVLIFGLWLTVTPAVTQAGLLPGFFGTTDMPDGNGHEAVVNSAVFVLDPTKRGLNDDGYGTGITNSTLASDGFGGVINGYQYLYLYQTINKGSGTFSSQYVGRDALATPGQIPLTTFSPNPLASIIGGIQQRFIPGVGGAALVADATAVPLGPFGAAYTDLLSGNHTDLWGYVSTIAPTIVFDGFFASGGGTNFPFGVGGDVPMSVTPEPGTLTLLGIGIVGIAGYGWRRRKKKAMPC
jgi:hypothetical protein